MREYMRGESVKVDGEQAVEYILSGHGVKFEREYHFNPARRWRSDFCIPEYKILIEIMGSTWTAGKHTRGAGYRNDCEKMISAQCLGYDILYYTSDMIRDNPGRVLDDVKNLIEGRKK
jgi:very-short-patch-repair endonuclease